MGDSKATEGQRSPALESWTLAASGSSEGVTAPLVPLGAEGDQARTGPLPEGECRPGLGSPGGFPGQQSH